MALLVNERDKMRFLKGQAIPVCLFYGTSLADVLSMKRREIQTFASCLNDDEVIDMRRIFHYVPAPE